jgi:hypothetical protein
MQAVTNHKEEICSPRIKAIALNEMAPRIPIKSQIVSWAKSFFIFVVFFFVIKKLR